MACAALLNRLLHGAGRFLAQAGQRIIFGQKPYNRLAAAAFECGGKSGGDPGDTLFNGKTLLLQGVDQRGGGAGLFVGKLRITPDISCQLDGGIRLGGHKFFDGLDHCTFLLFYNTMLRNLMVLGSCGQVKI